MNKDTGTTARSSSHMQTPQRRWHQSSSRSRKTGGFHPYSFSGFKHREPLFSCSYCSKGKPLIQNCMKPQKMCRTKERYFETNALRFFKHAKSLKSKTLHSKAKFFVFIQLSLIWKSQSPRVSWTNSRLLWTLPRQRHPKNNLSCDTLILLLPVTDKTRKTKVIQPNPLPKDWSRVQKNVSFSIRFDWRPCRFIC